MDLQFDSELTQEGEETHGVQRALACLDLMDEPAIRSDALGQVFLGEVSLQPYFAEESTQIARTADTCPWCIALLGHR
ncbi:hypothetical protein LR394_15935 [Kineosporia babensis]|uniref:Uncharacterized protein n=1 Tax=Kineosporia babensis TaxID=499548 RepID=A0A9X1STY0_9ACTN|nr:hypothetical protein [Kineosporia babensis]MCD5312399.1 hypothetical protein [Kineosporia babensis]